MCAGTIRRSGITTATPDCGGLQGIPTFWPGIASQILPQLDEYQTGANRAGPKGIQTKLVVPEDTTPKFFKPRSIPYATRGAIERT